MLKITFQFYFNNDFNIIIVVLLNHTHAHILWLRFFTSLQKSTDSFRVWPSSM